MTARRVAGVLLALAGAVGVTASAYLDWFSGRSPDSTPINRLFEDSVTEPATSYWTSVAMPLAAVTALAVLGLLVMSRLMLTLAWLVGVATLLLHVLQQVNDEARLALADVQTGVWVALAGLFVMLLGLVIMGGRRNAEDVETVSIMEPDPKETWYALSTTAKATPSSSAAASVPAVAQPSGSVVEPPPNPTPEPGPAPAPGPQPAPPPGPAPQPGPSPTPAPAPAPGPAPSPDREPGTPSPDEPETPSPDEPGTPVPPGTGSTDKPPRRG